jgi:transposase
MAGPRITDQQHKLFMNYRRAGLSQAAAAARAGFSERTAYRLERVGTPPSQRRRPRYGRTREDPLAEVWESELLPLLKDAPSLQATSLLAELQRRHPGRYPERLLRTLQRRVAHWRTVHGPERNTFEWMLAVLQRKVEHAALHREISELPDLLLLRRRLYNGRLSDRNRSMVVLASRRGLRSSVVCAFLGISKATHRRYLETYERGGAAMLFGPQTRSTRKFDNDALKEAVFGTLHEPPSNYGINRTSWKFSDLCRVLGEKGRPACPQVVRKIVKAAGYSWRRARVVLTSSDPAYSGKLDRIRTILSGLGPDEAFFSIDEFGPFAVRTKPGLTLTAPGEQRIVPQWQKSRGCLLMTAALELSGNQVTHFYSTKKNTAEMIRMMEVLVDQYRDRRKLYLSWDGASWHISKQLFQRIEQHNAAVLEGGGPVVETAPLPTGAQFLNVIESVFSGMARSIVHNSDYKTLDDAKAAFDRYFQERNAHFRQHPRRAGNKIWRKEREPAAFSEANNCKDPRYR